MYSRGHPASPIHSLVLPRIIVDPAMRASPVVGTSRTSFVQGDASTLFATFAADPLLLWRLLRAMVVGAAVDTAERSVVACEVCGSIR